jgi:hypothetical protein
MSDIPIRTTGDNLGWDFDDDPAPRRVRLLGKVSVDGAAITTASYRGSPTKLANRLAAMTRGQRKRFVRDLTICFATNQLKLSQRQVAEMFDLPHSRIPAIIKAMSGAG